ncbi:TRAP transporter small permease [Solicola gregarius]|uniref:TRAP transporter small permease n=1 Tax=Solicola gregarius TaxID=2908642 RepID=A0AA46TK78_9ACTN|nr:TRAP transporter small permease [Solicola gregarius]UYM06620.1 TRAP transporter small permease [Solicola gregarius]
MSAVPVRTRRSPLARLIRILTAVEMGVACLALALIFVLVLLQAAQRYLPIDSFTWTAELSQFGLVWLTFAAAGVLVTRDGHIALQLVDNIPNELVVRALHVLALVLVTVIGAGFAWACESLVEESKNLSSPSLGLPMSWVYVIPMIGFASTAVRAAVGAALVARYGVPASSGSDELDIQVNGPVDLDGRVEGEARP